MFLSDGLIIKFCTNTTDLRIARREEDIGMLLCWSVTFKLSWEPDDCSSLQTILPKASSGETMGRTRM